MRNKSVLAVLLLLLAAEAMALFLWVAKDPASRQDAVAVNEALQSVQRDWDALESHHNEAGLDYVVLDLDQNVRFCTSEGLSESIHEAVLHRDTILDVRVGGMTAGKIIFYNDRDEALRSQKRIQAWVLGAAMLAQALLCGGYLMYLNRSIVEPFHTLEEFAGRVAGGNLDIPLEMDRRNVFGAFTESFDLMRSELKKARIAEAQANESKKELVAKLSHDIKTPVASIKAASEVGAALTDNERLRDNYTQIIRKADQINVLVTNLFTATLDELKQLTVAPVDMESAEIKEMLENADYLHRAVIPMLPEGILSADPLRLQQVFDNIFANSYKYAGTAIEVEAAREGERLAVVIEDYGGGVEAEECLLLKEKFKRGSNAQGVEGAGLGLYIADYFMKEMGGELTVENGQKGLRVKVAILFSGAV